MNAQDRRAIRLGIGSYTYAWAVGVAGHLPARPLTALGLLDKAAQLNIRLVQICDNLPLDALAGSQLAELCERAMELGIELEVGTRGIQPEHLRRYIGLAIRCQSPLLRVVVDTATHKPSVEEVVELLSPMRCELEQAGVCLAIENHDRFSARRFCEIVRRLDSPHVGICLDTVNSFGALEGPEAVLTTLAPWVVNLHIKDFVIHRLSHLMGFIIEGCPAGQGRLDVPWLLEQLHEAGRRPNAVLEQWPPPEATLEATLAKEDQWARQSVAYLRSLIEE